MNIAVDLDIKHQTKPQKNYLEACVIIFIGVDSVGLMESLRRAVRNVADILYNDHV